MVRQDHLVRADFDASSFREHLPRSGGINKTQIRSAAVFPRVVFSSQGDFRGQILAGIVIEPEHTSVHAILFIKLELYFYYIEYLFYCQVPI